MWTVLADANSHVPRPPTTITMAVTASSRLTPLKAIVRPRITKGREFESRCPNPACRNGAVPTPTSPSGSRGSMPSSSSSLPEATSTTSATHITASMIRTMLKRSAPVGAHAVKRGRERRSGQLVRRGSGT